MSAVIALLHTQVFGHSAFQDPTINVCAQSLILAFLAFGATPPASDKHKSVSALCPETCGAATGKWADPRCQRHPPSPSPPPSPPHAPPVASVMRIVEPYPGLRYYAEVARSRPELSDLLPDIVSRDWETAETHFTWYLECGGRVRGPAL